MQAYMDVLRACPLFDGMAEADIEAALACLSARPRSYPRRALLFAAGGADYTMGVVLSGQVDIVQEDFWGNQGILGRLDAGDLFAESFALAQVPVLPVSVVASQACTVLLLDYQRILHPCTSICEYHARLIANLLSIAARKNIALTQKAAFMSKRTLREKLLAFLSAEAKQAGGGRFAIGYDRQALADYLAVDRSALSRALGDMQREGLISFSRNEFQLLE